MKRPGSPRPKADPDAIVAAARRIARERGWSAVTIRAIGDELGYASPVIYEHFRNKDDAISAAARLGFAELEAALVAVPESLAPEARLIAMAEAYVAFARRSPELYRVMHGLDGAATDPATIAAGATRVCEVAMTALVRWAETTPADIGDPLAATETAWCLLHGVATLALAGRLDTIDPASAVRLLLAGWRAASRPA